MTIEQAIEAEALDWARFFGMADDPEAIARRRMVMRANVAVGYFKPLASYLDVREG